MHCQPHLNWIYGLMATAATMILGAVVSGVIAMALNGVWVTAVFGAASVAIGITTIFAIAAAVAIAALFIALASYHGCIGGACAAAYGRVLLALGGISALVGVTFYASLAAANAVGWIPGAAIPPLLFLLGTFITMGVLMVAFGVAWAIYQNCVFATYGSVAGPITHGGGGTGTGGGRGSGPPPIRRLRPDRPREIYAVLNRGEWFRRWPGAIIDGSLGPDVCPICLYTIVVGGEIAQIDVGPDDQLQAIAISGGEMLTIDGDGKLLAHPFSYLRVTPNAEVQLLPGLIIQGVITQEGMLRGVIAGETRFDFEPYLDRASNL